MQLQSGHLSERKRWWCGEEVRRRGSGKESNVMGHHKKVYYSMAHSLIKFIEHNGTPVVLQKDVHTAQSFLYD